MWGTKAPTWEYLHTILIRLTLTIQGNVVEQARRSPQRWCIKRTDVGNTFLTYYSPEAHEWKISSPFSSAILKIDHLSISVWGSYILWLSIPTYLHVTSRPLSPHGRVRDREKKNTSRWLILPRHSVIFIGKCQTRRYYVHMNERMEKLPPFTPY